MTTDKNADPKELSQEEMDRLLDVDDGSDFELVPNPLADEVDLDMPTKTVTMPALPEPTLSELILCLHTRIRRDIDGPADRKRAMLWLDNIHKLLG